MARECLPSGRASYLVRVRATVGVGVGVRVGFGFGFGFGVRARVRVRIRARLGLGPQVRVASYHPPVCAAMAGSTARYASAEPAKSLGLGWGSG